MSRPESFVRATPERARQLLVAYLYGLEGDDNWNTLADELGCKTRNTNAVVDALFAALRDAVVAEKDAAFAVEREQLGEVSDQYREWWQGAEATVKREYARAERAEAEVARQRKVYFDIADATLPSSKGPEDIIAEIYRLREAERTLQAEVARLTNELAQTTQERADAQKLESASNEVALRYRADWKRERTRADKAEAALADAQRAGAWEALTRYGQSVPTLTAMASAHKFRDTHYAQPAPEPPSVRLGKYEIRWERDHYAAYLAGRLTHAAKYAIGICAILDFKDVSPTEYAELVALAESPDAE